MCNQSLSFYWREFGFAYACAGGTCERLKMYVASQEEHEGGRLPDAARLKSALNKYTVDSVIVCKKDIHHEWSDGDLVPGPHYIADMGKWIRRRT